jgi:hypothetical protein
VKRSKGVVEVMKNAVKLSELKGGKFWSRSEGYRGVVKLNEGKVMVKCVCSSS